MTPMLRPPDSLFGIDFPVCSAAAFERNLACGPDAAKPRKGFAMAVKFGMMLKFNKTIHPCREE